MIGRWVTRQTQNRNMRSNHIYKGKCISEWCEELGLRQGTINMRINALKWPIEKALGLGGGCYR